jgi:hypothetical protein
MYILIPYSPYYYHHERWMIVAATLYVSSTATKEKNSLARVLSIGSFGAGQGTLTPGLILGKDAL